MQKCVQMPPCAYAETSVCVRMRRCVYMHGGYINNDMWCIPGVRLRGVRLHQQ